jgi:hypothetical protein
MHEKGEGTEKNQKKALYWYEKAAEQGHAKAQNNCGVMYDSGKGTTMDKAKALYWYEKAAEQGHANAQYNLGLLYTQGKETENSREKALYWFKKAAEQGHEQAKSRLEFSEDEELLAEAQRAYDNKEFKRSFQIILPLAEKGIMKAQLMVSGQYYFGEGVEKDLEKAVFWLEKAKENGSEDAKKILPQFQMKLFGQLNEEGGQAMRAGDFDKHKELMKKAMHYAIQAAKQGLPIAVYTCAVTELVLDGNKESTEMDRFKAKQSLQEVAAQTEDLKAQELAKQALREYF